MKVFQLRQDSDQFQYFVFANSKTWDEYDELGLLEFDGTPVAAKWKPCEVKIHKPRMKKADFYGYCGGTFIVSPALWEKTAMFLEMAGELLPVSYQGEEWAFFNVTNCIDCVDEQKTQWRELPGGDRVIVKPAFDPGQFEESSIFKIPYSTGQILCYEATGDPETEFKAFVEAEKLTGLTFREIWSDEK